MKTTVIAALLISTALVAPFVYLELRFAHFDFPYMLFAVLWLVPASSVMAAAPLIRTVRAGNSVLARPWSLAARIGFLVVAAAFWTLVVNDQMPCLLGAPNCD